MRLAGLTQLSKAGALLTAVFSLATIPDHLHRLLQLFAHFRFQYFVVAAILAVVFGLLRDGRWAIGMLALAAVNAGFVVPWYVGAAPPSAAPALTVLHANVYGRNERHELLLALLRRERPDIVLVQEMRQGLALALEAMHDEYPHRLVVARDDNFGIAAYSRVPLERIEQHATPPNDYPSLLLRARIGSRSLTLLSTHPFPPLSRQGFAARNRQLEAVAAMIAAMDGPVALIGDLNTTMWAHQYEQLVATTGLRNARKGFGLLPSWPAQLPGLRIPIDHCLVSGDLEVRDIRTGAAIGSDHLPLIVTLALPEG